MLSRRTFVGGAAALTLGGVAAMAAQDKNEKKSDEDVSPPEDLMREHGVLNRILLIYDHARQQLTQGQTFPLDALHDAASIIYSFIESYHEQLEEAYLFPRFEKAGKLVDLVRLLKTQHQAGRDLTVQILDITASKSTPDRKRLVERLYAFTRMYRPHEAREDTVLFPALRGIVSEQEFDWLGEEFEKKEHELFGKAGFEGVVAHVADLEKRLGLYELAQFTPPVALLKGDR